MLLVIGDEEGGRALQVGASRLVARTRPHFDWLKHCKPDNFKPSLLELGNLGVGTSVHYSVGENVMRLKVVQRYHPSWCGRG